MRLYILGILMLATCLMAYGCSTEDTADNSTALSPAAEPAPTKSADNEKPSIPAPSRAANPEPAFKPEPRDVAPPPKVRVPAGTELTVVLLDPLSSATSKAGDEFQASLAAPLVIDGKTAAGKGATVNGKVVLAEDAGRVKGKASIQLSLTSFVVGGKTIPIATEVFTQEAEGTKGRDAGVIGGGAGIGAAIGGILGGKKGAGTGAVIGGAAGTGTVLATKGKEVEFGPEAKLTIKLERPAEFPAL